MIDGVGGVRLYRYYHRWYRAECSRGDKRQWWWCKCSQSLSTLCVCVCVIWIVKRCLWERDIILSLNVTGRLSSTYHGAGQVTLTTCWPSVKFVGWLVIWAYDTLVIVLLWLSSLNVLSYDLQLHESLYFLMARIKHRTAKIQQTQLFYVCR